MIALNAAWNLVNFRAGLIRALVAEGHGVVAVAPPDEYAPLLSKLGCRYVPLAMDNKGTHPGRDLALLWRFYKLLRKESPSVFLSYTVKPNVYGSLAAHALGIPVVNNIAGLGAPFIRNDWLTRVVGNLYQQALKRSARVFFQNEDDRRLFIERKLVRAEVTACLPGSGIDLERFCISKAECSVIPDAGRDEAKRVRFLLIARMLWDKGIGEYVEAARQVRRDFPRAEFALLGFLGVQNPAAISRQQIQAWVDEGVVNYLGETNDVRPFIAESDCVVLPSYREGTSRTLLEAAAMSRPIITTDAAGCREVVLDGTNGFLCQVRNGDDLAEKMFRMIRLTPEERAEMGRRGREKIEREFDERIVIQKYLETIQETAAAVDVECARAAR